MRYRFAPGMGVCLALLAFPSGSVAVAASCTLGPGETAYAAVLEDPSARFVDAGTLTAHVGLGARRSCVTAKIASGSGYVTARKGTVAYVRGGGTADSRITVVRGRTLQDIPLDGAARQFTPVVGPTGVVAYLDYADATARMRLRLADRDGRRTTVGTVAGSGLAAPSYSAPTWLPDGRLAVLMRSSTSASLSRLQVFRGTALLGERTVLRPFALSVLAVDNTRVVLSDYVGAPGERSVVLDLRTDTMTLLPAGSRPIAWNSQRSALLASAGDGTSHWLEGASFGTKVAVASIAGRHVVGGSHIVS